MGSYQINTRLGRNVYFPLLYLARKVLQLEGLVCIYLPYLGNDDFYSHVEGGFMFSYLSVDALTFIFPLVQELFSEIPFVYDEAAEIERESYLKAQPQVLDLELEQAVSMRGKGAVVTAEQQQRIRDSTHRRSQRELTKDDRDILMRQQAKYKFLKRVNGTYKLSL